MTDVPGHADQVAACAFADGDHNLRVGRFHAQSLADVGLDLAGQTAEGGNASDKGHGDRPRLIHRLGRQGCHRAGGQGSGGKRRPEQCAVGLVDGDADHIADRDGLRGGAVESFKPAAAEKAVGGTPGSGEVAGFAAVAVDGAENLAVDGYELVGRDAFSLACGRFDSVSGWSGAGQEGAAGQRPECQHNQSVVKPAPSGACVFRVWLPLFQGSEE